MKEIYDYINEAALNITEEEIVNQVHSIINAQWPEENVPRITVKLHVFQHVVNQNLTIARSVREMNHMASIVRTNVTSVDSQTGNFIVDERMAKLYLTFIAQINNMMKADNRRPCLNTGRAAERTGGEGGRTEEV